MGTISQQSACLFGWFRFLIVLKFFTRLFRSHRNHKHINRSHYHRVSDFEQNWKDRKHSERNDMEVFLIFWGISGLGYGFRQCSLKLWFYIRNKMKVQPCSVHRLPPKTSSVINLHTKKKIIKIIIKKRRQQLLPPIYCQINSAAPEMPSVSGERGCH